MSPVDSQGVFALPDVRVMVRKWAVDCGQRVTDRRVLCNMNRTQLGALTGTTEATISRVEQGSLNPRDHIKLLIAAALDTEVEALWPFPRRAEVNALAEAGSAA